MYLIMRMAFRQLHAGKNVLSAVCLIGICVSLGHCVGLLGRASLFAFESGPTTGDYIAFLLSGISQLSPIENMSSSHNIVLMPFGWLAIVTLPAVYVCIAEGNKKNTEQLAVLVASRKKSWAGRCFAALLACCIYWISVLLPCVFMSCVWGQFELVVSDWLPVVCEYADETLALPPYEVMPMLPTVLLSSYGLAIAQMALSEVLGGRWAFLASVVLLTGSVFAASPFLIGNNMMCARSTLFAVDVPVELASGTLAAGIRPEFAMGVGLLLAFISFIIGNAYISKRDFMGGGRQWHI